jgi:hypothetical protein
VKITNYWFGLALSSTLVILGLLAAVQGWAEGRPIRVVGGGLVVLVGLSRTYNRVKLEPQRRRLKEISRRSAPNPAGPDRPL